MRILAFCKQDSVQLYGFRFYDTRCSIVTQYLLWTNHVLFIAVCADIRANIFSGVNTIHLKTKVVPFIHHDTEGT